ncbi:MAG: HEPN domain-containing protein [Chloroflexi bacterium]|nr:HEPN domain-containing protein [Chloroflexota bacterium]
MPPSDPRVQLARDWLDRAERDLRLARLAVGDPSLSGLAAFHCQQAAEKALKAFLAWRNQPLPRTHDLPALLVRCQALEPAFAALQHAAGTLDVYLTAGRYPDTGPEPSAAEAEQALQLAEQVVAFVAARLPQGNQP